MMYKARSISLLCILLMVLSALPVNAQSTNASVSGTVTDNSGGVIEGANVTILNTKTGVTQQTVSNGEGVYEFPNLQPGTYQITVEKEGFRKSIINDVILEIGGRPTLNLQLEAGGVTETVQVSASENATLQRESTSVAGVISGQRVRDLPLPARDVLGLVLTQGGLIGDNFGGTRIGALNITRDGINVQDNRINSGVFSTVFNSVDLIEEVRVITSPADAEFGRGSGQIQLITRSGTNEFHGSLFESHRNTALNANTWANNRQGLPRNQLIRNQFGGRIGGPIKKNKTFFHFLYDGQRIRQGTQVTSTVYTQQARLGMFRFYPGVQNGNANALNPTVDVNGNPVRPAAATGDLRTVDLLTRDPNRNRLDPSGLISRYLNFIPLPNNFRAGDGLNTAGFTWLRSSTSDFNNYSARIDHQFNDEHRLSYSYSNENSENLNGFMPQPFPGSPGGNVEEKTRFHSLNLVSTLTPTLLNDFRVGLQRPLVRFFAPWEESPDSDLVASAGGQQFLYIFPTVTDVIDTSNDPQGRISPVYQFSDTLSWLKGRHSFKGGAEVRFVSTNGFNSFSVFPRVTGGSGGTPLQGITNIAGIGANSGLAGNILNGLSGSVANIVQAFNAPGGEGAQFLAGEVKQRTWKQKEFAFFFKDDFKWTPNFTLNVGLRYEFYSVPYDPNGKTATLEGGTAGAFGISGTDYSAMFNPNATGGSLTEVVLIGPGTSRPDEKLYNNDWNNFGPSVGFSWSLPWFGKDKTVLRAGYGMGFERNALRLVDVVSGDLPGLRSQRTFTQAAFLGLSGVSLPLTPLGTPLSTVPVTDRTQTVNVFDNNLRTPYYQNWNVTLQRDLGWGSVVEVRYVGNKGSKLIRGTNINEINIFENGILEAFLITQAGGHAPLLNRIFNGINVAGLGVVNGTTITGSDAVRAISTTQAQLANNNVGAFANFLNTTTTFTGQVGGLIRRAGLPENFIIANPQFAAANLLGNFANSSYHSFQVDVTKRYSNGLQFQSNYTFAKALGEEPGASQNLVDSYRTSRNRSLDKRRLDFDISHAFRTSWTYEMPFGPGRKFLSGSNSWVSRLVERWQFGGIFNAFSGEPLTVLAQISSFNGVTADNTGNVVGAFPANIGKVVKKGDIIQFFDNLRQVADPYIGNITTQRNIQSLSTLRAITDSQGNLILVNPVPGALGSLVPFYVEGPGTFRFDVNLLKRVRIKESKELEFRVTALNVLNKPIWGNPNTDINSLNFGRITTATGNRILVVDARFNF